MKNLSKLFFAALTVWAFNAQADLKSADIRIGQQVALTNCKGTATLNRNSAGKLMLYVRGTECSNLRTEYSSRKLDGYEQNRYVDVHILEDGRSEAPVLIGGNAYVDSNGARGVGDLLNVIIPVPENATLPSNWSYRFVAEMGLFGVYEVCYLVDSNGTAVMEMVDSACYSGSRALPEGAFYSRSDDGTNACYLWADRYTRISANAVKKEKCN